MAGWSHTTVVSSHIAEVVLRCCSPLVLIIPIISVWLAYIQAIITIRN